MIWLNFHHIFSLEARGRRGGGKPICSFSGAISSSFTIKTINLLYLLYLGGCFITRVYLFQRLARNSAQRKDLALYCVTFTAYLAILTTILFQQHGGEVA